MNETLPAAPAAAPTPAGAHPLKPLVTKQVLRATGQILDSLSRELNEPVKFLVAAAVEQFLQLSPEDRVRAVLAIRTAAVGA